jgi:hypothetical protein
MADQALFDMSKLKEQIEKIDRETAQLRSEISLVPVAIVEECDKARNQLDIAVETRIAELNDIRREYLTKIKIYQEECLQNLEETKIRERAEEFAKNGSTKRQHRTRRITTR